MSKPLICAAVFLGLAQLANAQHTPGVMAVPSAPIPIARPVAVAPGPTAHAAAAGAPHATAAGHPHVNSAVTGKPSAHNSSRPGTATRPNKLPPRPVNPNFVHGTDFVNQVPVPGLGFDYAHFFAVHPNWQRDHPSTGTIFPFIGGGLYLPAPYFEAAAAGNETADSNDSPAAEPGSQEVTENTNPEPASTRIRSRSNPAPAPANTTEYVFVRRDGTVFFAVAYSWMDGKLQYITQDGLRKFALLDTLDLQATRQFNEQSGQTLTTPSL